MHVTLGEDGSGVSKAQPFFLLPAGNMGDDCPPFMLPLHRSLLLRDGGRVDNPSRNLSVLPGLRMDLEEIFMEELEEDDALDVKQIKSSLLLLPLRWGLSPSISFIHKPQKKKSKTKI